MIHPLRTLPAALAALALCLAGCGDDPEPTFAPPEETTSAPTSPTGPSGGTTSAAPELSPVQTVEAWVDARNLVVNGEAANDVYALSTANCKTCRDSVEPVLAVYEDGGRYETDGWTIDSAKPTPDFAKSHEVAVAIIYAAGRTIPSAQDKPVSYDEEKHIMIFDLSRVSGSWKISQVGYLS